MHCRIDISANRALSAHFRGIEFMKKLLICLFTLAFFHTVATAGPLHLAIKDGDVDQVRLLVAEGEDVNKRDRYLGWPLHQAAITNSLEIAELLIAEGADVNVEHSIFGNPLFAAALMSSVDVAAFLLANGADPNPELANERGAISKTPLHIAAEVGSSGMVDLLVANGADINARSGIQEDDTATFSPLHSAALSGHANVVALLRALGATPPAVEPISVLLDDADPTRGEELYFTRESPLSCVGCHTIEMGVVDQKYYGAYEGPNLWGIVGRDLASDQSFDYSEQLSQLGGFWTVPELNAFIASAVDYLPGTSMSHLGMPDVRDRADLIAFLGQNSDDPIDISVLK
jgi:cytochrome c